MKPYELIVGDCADVLRSMPDRSVDLVFTSPPYEDARTYQDGADGKKFKLKGQDWVDWLAPIIVESARVSRGLVIVNVSGVVRRFSYSYAPEWLCADLTRVHGLAGGPAPYAWTKNGQPGSGGQHYHRRNWEPLYCFALRDRLPLAYSNQLAFGKPPVCAPGGQFRTRKKDGQRHGVMADTTRRANGSRRTIAIREQSSGVAKTKFYQPPDLANPGNVLRASVGGGHQGSKFAHLCEAPMPESLAMRFVRWYVPPGGVVLDTFAGSGTTLAASMRCGRRGIGIEQRGPMAEIAEQRLTELEGLLHRKTIDFESYLENQDHDCKKDAA
jgi:site-specific DNA-methyltransferase (adenine-specific)